MRIFYDGLATLSGLGGGTPGKEDKEMMPVLSAVRMDGSPREIPMEWLTEDMANANHSQTLSRLKERGGMSCAEMWCNIHRQGLRNLPSEMLAIQYLKTRLNNLK